ncbi:MAG: hypothetical protein U1F67_01955 [Rubrivivax sp.]
MVTGIGLGGRVLRLALRWIARSEIAGDLHRGLAAARRGHGSADAACRPVDAAAGAFLAGVLLAESEYRQRLRD